MKATVGFQDWYFSDGEEGDFDLIRVRPIVPVQKSTRAPFPGHLIGLAARFLRDRSQQSSCRSTSAERAPRIPQVLSVRRLLA